MRQGGPGRDVDPGCIVFQALTLLRRGMFDSLRRFEIDAPGPEGVSRSAAL